MTHHFDLKSRAIHLPVKITGPKAEYEARFILDTGAMTSLIDFQVLSHIGYSKLDFLGEADCTTASRSEKVHKIKISKINALHLTRSNFQVITKKFPDRLMVDGLLGIDFLMNHKLAIDFKAGILTFE